MNRGGAQRELIDGRFEPLQRLGGGGMGVVWRAYDTALDREVALKEVRPADPATAAADPEGARTMRERVLREARALARLQHPNVVTIHHIIDTAEYPHPYLVMELVHGGSLADRLASGPLGVPEAARIGRGVLAALRAAHAGGIQHRDVKPGNILLRADGTPVLTDFGIATLHDATALTAAGSLIGSPEYMAPERIRGHEGGPASDLWSLAMTLYVALEGRHPLRRSGTLSTLAAILDEPLPPPRHCGPLAPLLTAMLAKDPARRPDAAAADRALAAVEHGAPYRAEPVSGDDRAAGGSPTGGVTRLAPAAATRELPQRSSPAPTRRRRTNGYAIAGGCAVLALLAVLSYVFWPAPGGSGRSARSQSPTAQSPQPSHSAQPTHSAQAGQTGRTAHSGQAARQAPGRGPWKVSGYGWTYTVESVSRTTSEWVPDPRPSLTITADLERGSADEFSHMTYRVSDPGSGTVLDADPLASSGDSEPPARQRSRLVQVFWDTDPRATHVTITLHDFYWPAGRDLVLKDIPVTGS
ncbi:protein kinase [Streptomyces sp. NPDC006739]|uniref:serine/threonine-protein kinase n=1 Tax=Streptomyces sp. NPDC006739 TaxID=3364763 RepID=UPI0036B11A9D